MEESVSGGAVIVVIAVGVLVGVGLIWALLSAAKLKDPALVVTSLSLITMAALVGYGLTRLEIMGGLAATGIGALAGAIAGLYQKPKEDDESPPEDDITDKEV